MTAKDLLKAIHGLRADTQAVLPEKTRARARPQTFE